MKIFKMVFLFLIGALLLALNPPGQWLWAAAVPPMISQVQQTADGYMLIGGGFGNDRARVQLFEGNTQVPAASVTYVADGVISVRSQPSGAVQHRVVVAGQSSNLFSFNYPVAAAAPPARPNITSISPNSGAQGATVDVNITGTNLTGAKVRVGLTGVVVEMRPGAGATSLPIRMRIDSSAHPGPRTLEVTTTGGTTAVPFTVLQTAATAPTMKGVTQQPITKEQLKTGVLLGKPRVAGGVKPLKEITKGQPSGSDDPCAPRDRDVKIAEMTKRMQMLPEESKDKDRAKRAREGLAAGSITESYSWEGAGGGQERVRVTHSRDDQGNQKTVERHESWRGAGYAWAEVTTECSGARCTTSSEGGQTGNYPAYSEAEKKESGRAESAMIDRQREQAQQEAQRAKEQMTREQQEAQKAQEKAEKEKAEKEKAEKAAKEKAEKEKAEKTAKTTCIRGDDRCVYEVFGRNDPIRDRQRKELAEKIERRKQFAVGQSEGRTPDYRDPMRRKMTDAEALALGRKIQEKFTQPAGEPTAQADPCPEGRPDAQKIKEAGKELFKGKKYTDPTPQRR